MQDIQILFTVVGVVFAALAAWVAYVLVKMPRFDPAMNERLGSTAYRGPAPEVEEAPAAAKQDDPGADKTN